MPVHKKKRKFEMGRQATMTKLGKTKVTHVRGRGGNYKHRALRADHGNFAWGSEGISRKARILDVVYNATNNELVRTKTLVKNAIVMIDSNPFREWYKQHYNVELNTKKLEEKADAPVEEKKRSRHAAAILKHRQSGIKIDQKVANEFNSGHLLACIASRPGQSGRVDGYILEGRELEFYVKKTEKKKK